ncbi:Rne/Rng family ribonuclease [Thalassospira lucentensis]|uniref:Rne/Rng family ribonuclease n=1 Tax=Thalassospira lucentensis TaxID=168935 RepID=UPI0003B4640E|nr:Rne/Rng family ribonuclease [Thalassospira lucentensis]RCK24724.1 ribonuclease E [Thalassospira lucentensis MCCC 1A00383 = DSM 14000]
MVKRMLIDATHAEESRVVVINGNRLEEYDVETSTKKQIKGNIYLAKVTRVEPSLQAAFVDYGGNRHGFLAFSEIHSDYYQIPVADREALTQSHTRNVKDAEIVEDNVSDGEDSQKKEKKPTRSRSRRKPRAKDKDETVEAADADASPVEATATADATTSPDSKNDATTGSDEEDAKPRRRRTRNRRKKSDEVDASTADADAKDASPSEDNTSDANTGSDGDDTPTGGNAAMSAEVAELTVDIDADGSDGDTVSEINAKSDEEDIEDLGGDDADEFVESHSRQLQKRYKIQEVIKRRQILLVQVVKEERGNKGAALSTFLSLAGRYCVLMPNTPRGGGISRKITNAQDRKRLKSILAELEIPDGMAVIVRTAGAERTKAEIKRDFDYLMRLWDRIRETTLQSQAPCLIYEEADLIKRSIRDLYARDVDEVLVEGDEGYRIAKDFMKMLMPSHAKRVQPYKDQGVPLFHRFQVESQLDAMLNPVVQLKSGGYIVINPTEALVAIDVNSGRSTRERNIEETAYKTNLEAAEELARQLRLRDLAGLIVVDFIDMEDHRNQGAVERKIKEAMRNDRARLQIGRISPFGLLEMSRQRLRPSLVESAFEVCTHCRGVGLVRSIESAALHLLRVLEEEGMRRRSGSLTVHVASEVALYILNRKRETLAEIEQRYGFTVMIFGDDSLISPDHRIERSRAKKGDELEDVPAVLNTDSVSLTAIENPIDTDDDDEEEEEAPSAKNTAQDDEEQGGKRRRRRRRRRGRNDDRDDRNDQQQEASDAEAGNDDNADQNSDNEDDDDEESQRKRRRRGKRGGRRRSRRQDFEAKSTRSPNDDPALTAARRNRDHEAPDGAEENTVIDAESEGQDADSFDQEGVREGRSRSTTAPAPARPRRDRNDNRRNRRDRNDRPRGKDSNNDSGDDRGDVKNIPIQSGPAPEADANSKPDATAAAPAAAPAEVAVPKEATPVPKPEEKVAPKAEKPAEKAPEPKAEAKPEPVAAEKPTPASEPAPAPEPAKDKKSEPKKRGWWSLGR